MAYTGQHYLSPSELPTHTHALNTIDNRRYTSALIHQRSKDRGLRMKTGWRGQSIKGRTKVIWRFEPTYHMEILFNISSQQSCAVQSLCCKVLLLVFIFPATNIHNFIYQTITSQASMYNVLYIKPEHRSSIKQRTTFHIRSNIKQRTDIFKYQTAVERADTMSGRRFLSFRHSCQAAFHFLQAFLLQAVDRGGEGKQCRCGRQSAGNEG